VRLEAHADLQVGGQQLELVALGAQQHVGEDGARGAFLCHATCQLEHAVQRCCVALDFH